MTDANWAPPSLIDALSQASNVVVMTGAGISSESGVPTFREAQTGLWEKFNPEDLATPEAFARDPRTAWDWYRWRRELVDEAVPNTGHTALAELSSLCRSLTLVTQNVDGLHQRAGSENVIEFHGNLFVNRCPREQKEVASDLALADETPTCPDCGDVLRPGVVLFGELIPQSVLEQATEAVNGCDVFFSIGTSSLVFPAAGLAEAALRGGALFVEINTDDTPVTSLADHALRGSAADILPAIVTALKNAR